MLAHEAAHHINGDTLIGNDWTKDQELAADYSGAVWLTRLGVTRDQLLQMFNSLGLPSESVNGYPTRAERRLLKGYEDGYSRLVTTTPPIVSIEETPQISPVQQEKDRLEQLERCYAVAQSSCMSDCIYNYHNSDKTCRQKLCSRETNLARWSWICRRDLENGRRY